ncbi:hypothetical protein [Herbaspirillum rubrisubalbicans]|uniref:hypothetical protein n=1 Tax=Herbaspirillum rubrisubalbicans TaxID=80842 RepID=UPI0015C55397|nr:hypothetical protein [Herbaspirillum rubrisubalbicans]NQE51546.1 hypothetical protein [Herbaspirillum rubrisubalbicans]
MIRLMFGGLVIATWLYQFAGHAIWRYLPWISADKTGFPLILIAVSIIGFPLLMALRPRAASPKTSLLSRREDLPAIGMVLAIGLVFWAVFAMPWTHLALHTRGDELFHNERTRIEYDYWRQLLGAAPPMEFPSAHFIFYPSGAYFLNTLLAWLQGDAGSIVFQRQSQLLWFMLVPMASYSLCRILSISRRTAILFAAIPAVSPLLASFTVSYYIELPYVPLELAAFAWLLIAERESDKPALWLAVGMASAATLIRESVLPVAFFIVCAAIWMHIRHTAKPLKSFWFAIWAILAGLLPCIAYSLVKRQFAGPASTRLSLENFLNQDWHLLALYGLVYLNAIMLALVVYGWRCRSTDTRITALAAFGSMGGSLLMYGLFDAGWMPWSRNFALLIAPLLVVAAIASAKISSTNPNGAGNRFLSLQATLAYACIFNIGVAAVWFKDDRMFHENEAIFDLAPAMEKLAQKGQAIKIYEHRPPFMRNQLPLPPQLELINVAPEVNRFMPLQAIEKHLPSDAHWILYYYYRNTAAPSRLHAVPQAPREAIDTSRFAIRLTTDDPFSQGRIGVALLERMR